MTLQRLHILDGCDVPAPERFTYPFRYRPHPLAARAAKELQLYLESVAEFQEEISFGKMFGVLVVGSETGIGYLAAFSGLLHGSNDLPFFVPAVYDMLHPEGHFKVHENEISAINDEVSRLAAHPERTSLAHALALAREAADKEISAHKDAMDAAKRHRDLMRGNVGADELIRQSQFMKAELRRIKRRHEEVIAGLEAQLGEYDYQIAALKKERQKKSEDLQKWIFTRFKMRNALGDTKDLNEIFSPSVPPAGSGECCAPKLLQYAYLHGLKPLCMAEFWWGRSPVGEIRRHLQYYPSCNSKCKPILGFMLQGLDVEPNPMEDICKKELELVYEDDCIAVAAKPEGMLSVPGKDASPSVYSILRQRFPDAEEPMIVHRLDMDTSGLMVIAKTKTAHENLQKQFEEHSISKTYIALLEHAPAGHSSRHSGLDPESPSGRIELPLRPDLEDRPRQVVDHEHGKTAVTTYRILAADNGIARIELIPHTGRTHQLRVHCAHPEGLDSPIVGDPLYGSSEGRKRMFLHAAELSFTHPSTGQRMKFRKEPDF